MRAITSISKANELSNLTSLKTYLPGVTYEKLVEKFGEPVYQNEPDEKCIFMWVFVFKGKTFTVYDWMSPSKNYAKYQLTHWRVGGHTYAGDFVEALEKIIKN